MQKSPTIHLPATDVKHARTQVGPATVGGHRPAANSTSGNWSGYAAYGTTFTGVYGSWIVPRVNCGILGTGASSTWIGVDGYGTSTVEQLGTRQNCLWGVASYYPWYEVYPQSEVALPSGDAVYPGDTMWAETIHTGASNYFFVMGGPVSRLVVEPERDRSRSGAVERLGRVDHRAAQLLLRVQLAGELRHAVLPVRGGTAGRRYWGPINAYWNDAITMVNGSTVKAVPSGLTNGTYSSSFADRFVHS